MVLVLVALLALGALGHTILWVALVNRIHGLGIERRWVDFMTFGCCVALVALPPAVGLAVLPQLWGGEGWLPSAASHLAWAYVVGSALVSLLAAAQRWMWRTHPERQKVVVSNHTWVLEQPTKSTESFTAPGWPTWLSHIPGNQVVQASFQEKQLVIPRLPRNHDGLRIAHLSDLHMSGRITKAYFKRIVEEVNRCEPDLIAITGDIVERSECLDWIADTLGRLRAASGVYFVLGNHDRHVDRERLVTALVDAGLVYLGGTWREVIVRDMPLILAGNELPWFGPAADLGSCPKRDRTGLPLRVLLAHSPDQFRWAQRNEIDLVLAGHNHGGQVCLPIIGPITAPSLHGVRYAAGAFRAGQTVLHVSRGISSLTPLRWNCPPEIAVLNLRSGDFST